MLEVAPTGSWESLGTFLANSVTSLDSFKLIMSEACTLWKLANSTKQGSCSPSPQLVVKHLPEHHQSKHCHPGTLKASFYNFNINLFTSLLDIFQSWVFIYWHLRYHCGFLYASDFPLLQNKTHQFPFSPHLLIALPCPFLKL